MLAWFGSLWNGTEKHRAPHALYLLLCVKRYRCVVARSIYIRYATSYLTVMADPQALIALCKFSTTQKRRLGQCHQSVVLRILCSRKVFTARLVLLLAIVFALYTNTLANVLLVLLHFHKKILICLVLT